MKTKIGSLIVMLSIVLSCKNKPTVSAQIVKETYNASIDKISLKGKIAVEPNSPSINKCIILNGEKPSSSFLLPENKENSYLNIAWLNTKDLFLATEIKYQCENVDCILKKWTKDNLVLLDTTGKIIEKVYESAEREKLYYYYPSPNDSLLLFFTEISPQSFNSINGLKDDLIRKSALNIFNLKTKKIIKKVENFATFLQLDINESPWSSDGSKFVYGINSDRKVRIMRQDVSKVISKENGLYIYDLKTGESTLIASNGKSGSWAPGGKYISFIEDNKIWLYNPTNKNISVIFDSFINYYHWAPDGKYLYIIGESNDWLVRVTDKKFFNIGKVIGNWANITWKN